MADEERVYLSWCPGAPITRREIRKWKLALSLTYVLLALLHPYIIAVWLCPAEASAAERRARWRDGAVLGLNNIVSIAHHAHWCWAPGSLRLDSGGARLAHSFFAIFMPWLLVRGEDDDDEGGEKGHPSRGLSIPWCDLMHYIEGLTMLALFAGLISRGGTGGFTLANPEHLYLLFMIAVVGGYAQFYERLVLPLKLRAEWDKALLAHLAMEVYYTAMVWMWAALAFTACP